MSNYVEIYEIVKSIPKGKVMTYGQIAEKLGNIHMSRVVGNALHNNPDPQHIPCHRIVNRNGECAEHYAFGGKQQQIKRLKSEGVGFIKDKVNLTKYGV